MSPIVDAGGLRVRYELHGPQTLAVVALCHSIGTNRGLWETQVVPFSQQFRVLRFDLRGHGETDVTSGDYTIEQMANDCLALFDALEIDRVHFCGVSLGGFIGQWLGARASSRIDKLVLSNTAPVIGPRSIWQERIALVRARGMSSVAAASVDRWFTPAFVAREPEIVRHTERMLLDTHVDGYVGACAAIRDMDLRPLLPSITCPTLVIGGIHDRVTPDETAQQMTASIPNARFVSLDAAHLANVEDARAYNAAALEFLTSTGD